MFGQPIHIFTDALVVQVLILASFALLLTGKKRNSTVAEGARVTGMIWMMDLWMISKRRRNLIVLW